MISYREAREILSTVAEKRKLSPSLIPLTEAVGLILAEDIVSPEAVPSFDNSAMDGFALFASQTASASEKSPLVFEVAGSVAAGDPGTEYADKDSVAIEIMTGAPVPAGRFDAVVKIEDVLVSRDEHGNPVRVTLKRPLRQWENIRKKGEDFEVGQPVAPAGQEVTPEVILALSSLGVDRVRARRRPKVALISTGKEIVDHGTKALLPGMIRNSTGPYLMSALPLCGADVRFYGTIQDDPEAFGKLLKTVCAEAPDVVLTTGAVSMGKYDFVRESLEKAGAQVLFHKAAIRPGKPLLFAEMEAGPVFFGVPGNPVSTLVGLRFFIEPFLTALRGRVPEGPVLARLKENTKKPKGLRCFFKARVDIESDGASVRVLPGQASFMVSPLLQANAWVVLPEEGEAIARGTAVEVYPFFPWSYPWNSNPRNSMKEVEVTPSGHDHHEKGCCV